MTNRLTTQRELIRDDLLRGKTITLSMRLKNMVATDLRP